ncbi:pyridoxal phosphate-dependent transferase [Cytidiella melzeri]|nr:pyridoxal phosphate-dependent transferase [Cytidiella melzeri]
MPGINAVRTADLSHHLSIETRQRKPNAMKVLWRLTRGRPNMISLATGDPHYSLYPVKSINYEVASAAADIEDPVATWKEAASSSSTPTQWFTSSRDESCSLPIKTAMAYSDGAGLPQAQRAVTELTTHYHSPWNHVCTLTVGNMDGVTKCFRLLGSPGDHFLADEFSFNALTNAPLAHGVSWVPVKIDKGGLIPEDLERVMVSWDERLHGRRPHVLYTVPTGQNPTGCTLSVERREKIYALCQRFDIMIIEDDPYYYLQYVDIPEGAKDTLIPSFLSMDVDGRVLRVDSFSKILMPGMRLGWITSSQLFHEHLIFLNDSSTQHPHGFGQIFITEMLSSSGWQLSGFDRWTRSLRREYQRRRDIFLDHFSKEVASTGYASAEPPQAGMFVWIDVHVKKHPRYTCEFRDTLKSPKRTNVPELMNELFERCLDAGLVVMPASIFVAPMSESTTKLVESDVPIHDSLTNVSQRVNFLRTTFAGEEALMQPGLVILGQVLTEFFQK